MVNWVAKTAFPNTNGVFEQGLADLGNGKILTIGGQSYHGSDVQEPHCYLYDIAGDSYTATGDLNHLRTVPGVVILDNGKVLAIGGRIAEDSQPGIATCELYDPNTGLWTDTGSMATARFNMGVWKLANGDVLVACGNTGAGGFSQTATTELYSVADGTWSDPGHNLPTAVGYPFYFSLADGMPIMAGGWHTGGVAITETYSYNPSTGWTKITDVPTGVMCNDTTHILPLSNGNFMMVGASDSTQNGITSVYVFDVNTLTWSTVGSLNKARTNCFTGALSNGGAFVAGGETQGAVVTGGEVYDPIVNTWSLGINQIVDKFLASQIYVNGTYYSMGGAIRPLASLTDSESYTVATPPPATSVAMNPSMLFML